ncbi:hypothetical protein [Dyella sp.]|uniref:hypothetical protein n=1 Tax=Dyella sp. TaxID=1869338 RepID=UPI002ED47D70
MLSFCLVASTVSAKDVPSLFDKPLRETHLPLPNNPNSPQAKPELSCWYYPHLMIKQVDIGEKGAEQLSMIPVAPGQATPACKRTHDKAEQVISNWSGYFWGVKGDYAFFKAADGFNGGTGFAIFNAVNGDRLQTGTMADDHLLALQSLRPAGIEQLDERRIYPLLVRYKSLYQAPCSLRSDETACWNAIRQITGLVQAAPPDCGSAYATQEQQATSAKDKAQIARNPTVLTYDVEAIVDDQGVLRFAATSPSTACYPAE